LEGREQLEGSDTIELQRRTGCQLVKVLRNTDVIELWKESEIFMKRVLIS